VISLVPDQPEDNKWLLAEMYWEAGILHDLGYVSNQSEWEDFMDHMCESAQRWIESVKDKADNNE